MNGVQHCIFHVKQFKVLRNFEKSHFPIVINGDAQTL